MECFRLLCIYRFVLSTFRSDFLKIEPRHENCTISCRAALQSCHFQYLFPSKKAKQQPLTFTCTGFAAPAKSVSTYSRHYWHTKPCCSDHPSFTRFRNFLSIAVFLARQVLPIFPPIPKEVVCQSFLPASPCGAEPIDSITASRS